MPISTFRIISHWKLQVSIATRVLIWLEQTTKLFVPPIYRCYMWNMERIGFTASEEKSFENVDERQRMDGRQMPAYTISSPMGLRLRWAKTNSYLLKRSLWIIVWDKSSMKLRDQQKGPFRGSPYAIKKQINRIVHVCMYVFMYVFLLLFSC